MIKAILQSMRPKQWTKNFFLFAGLLFTLDKHHPFSDVLKVVLGFFFFCVLSGSIYILNDIRDVERDKAHPRKAKRPIASGQLPISTAWVTAILLLVLGIIGSLSLDIRFSAIAFGFCVLQIAYSAFLKELVIIDVIVISLGFVLRAVAGAQVINISISPWLLICTILLALFLALAKRRGELLGLQEEALNHRPSLEHYTVPFLDQLMTITAASTIISYALYTFFSDTGKQHPNMVATLPFVLYGIFRYLLLVHNDIKAENPEILLLKDKPLLVTIGLWIAACAVIVIRY